MDENSHEIDINDSQGIVVGDYSTQLNHYNFYSKTRQKIISTNVVTKYSLTDSKNRWRRLFLCNRWAEADFIIDRPHKVKLEVIFSTV